MNGSGRSTEYETIGVGHNLSAMTRYYPARKYDPVSDAGVYIETQAELVFKLLCSGTVTNTIEHAAVKDYKTTPAAGEWTDITSQFRDMAGASAASYVDATKVLRGVVPPGRVRVKSVTADATNDVLILMAIKPCDTSGVVPSGAATDAELALILAKLSSDPATQTTLAAILALTGGQRNSTAPNVTTTTARLLELARDGSLRVNADLYDFLHQTHLVATTAAAQAAFVRTPPTYPFDGIWTDTDGVVVFGQPRGRPYLVADGLTFADPTKWTTAGTDWTVSGNKATHAASGAGADELVGTMGSPLQVGKTYAVYCKGTKTSGTSATVYCGTAAGTAITANGAFEFIQPLVCTGSSACKIVATDDCEIEFTAYQIYTRSPKLAALCYNPFAFTEIVGVAAGGALTTLIVATSCDVHGLYRRIPAVADLG